ncbi:MAG TPA: prephenate dehydrogenase/arogenate dehydrogenase family protein, partial [Candidatus Avipropionibacterium avicola]|nr:prephenate dehydrogenase/arogenate dehydrogenase family protein [Candidatus Avipropionibacterium avicola]
MELGLVGLGKMGGNMRDRLRSGGHTVIGYDTNPELSDASSMADMVDQLGSGPRIVWLMVPVQFLDNVLDELAPLLSEGDIVIDGGNTRWSEDRPRAERLAESGVHFIDCGVSGGVWGKDAGYALMVGGPTEQVEHCQPIFQTLKPEGPYGYVHAGDHGAGHFAKMVHNGI